MDIGEGRDTVKQVKEGIVSAIVDRDSHETRGANAGSYGELMKFDKIHGEYLVLAENILERRG